MAIIVKLIYWFVALLCVLVIGYTYYSFDKMKKSSYIDLPHFFEGIGEIIDSIVPLKVFASKLELDASLVYGSTDLGRMYSICVVMVLLPVSTIVFMSINIFCSTWYMSLVGVLLALILPVMYFRSNLTDKTIRIRKSILKSQENIASSLAYNPVVLDSAQTIARTSSGPTKTLYKIFCNNYVVDRDMAYDIYQKTVNDSYTKTFVDILKRFEEQGINPIEPLQRNAKMASRHYYIKGMGRKVFNGLKIMVIIYLASCVGVSYMGVYLQKAMSGNVVENALSSSPSFFICLCLNLVALILCFVYENV